MRRKWFLTLMINLIVISLALTPIVAAQNRIPLTFWYSLGGASSAAIQELVFKFNQSQDKYELTAEYQGSYNDSLLKFTSTPTAQRPDVIHINEIGTATILDMGDYYPIQDFIDNGQLDISPYMTNVLNAYRYSGKMYAFPFSITVPAIYYNQEAFEKAGIDPSTLATYKGFSEASKKLVSSGVTEYGACIVNDTWIYEQLMASMNLDIVDNGNGRQGRATKLVADENGALNTVLSLMKEFNDEPTTFVATKSLEARTAFASQQVGMYIETAGNYGVTKQIVEDAFTIQQKPLFRLDGYENGLPYASGAALWVVDKGNAQKASGVIEFIKFFMEQENQVEFALATGYLPIREDVINDERYQDYVTNVNPGNWEIVEELIESTWPGGALFNSLGEFRRVVNSQILAMHDDKKLTVDKVIKEVTNSINEQIMLYNLSN